MKSPLLQEKLNYKLKTYYYIYGRSNGKHCIQVFWFDPFLSFPQIAGQTCLLTPQELESKHWIESDFDHIIDLVHKDKDEWEKGQLQLAEKEKEIVI